MDDISIMRSVSLRFLSYWICSNLIWVVLCHANPQYKSHNLPGVFDGWNNCEAFCHGQDVGYYCNVMDKRFIYRCPYGGKLPTRGKGFFCAADGAVPSWYRGEKGFKVQEFCKGKQAGTYIGPKNSHSIAIWKCPECLPVEYCKPGHYPFQANDTFAMCKLGYLEDSESEESPSESKETDPKEGTVQEKTEQTSRDCECPKEVPCSCKPNPPRTLTQFVHAIPKCALWTTVTPCPNCGHSRSHSSEDHKDDQKNHNRHHTSPSYRKLKPTKICLSTTYCNIKCTEIHNGKDGCYCKGWRYEPKGCQCKGSS
jgi:hypothetical protein